MGAGWQLHRDDHGIDRTAAHEDRGRSAQRQALRGIHTTAKKPSSQTTVQGLSPGLQRCLTLEPRGKRQADVHASCCTRRLGAGANRRADEPLAPEIPGTV